VAENKNIWSKRLSMTLKGKWILPSAKVSNQDKEEDLFQLFYEQL
jgi:hypothetical protein